MQLVIFDTEFTAWAGSSERNWSEPWEHKELIQLAAVKLAVSEAGLAVIASFNELIRPAINPQLSEYIVHLTGITQTMLTDMGVDFPSALEAFYQFCQQGQLASFAWGHDANILADNCQLNHITMPNFNAGLFNLQRIAKGAGIEQADLSSGQLAEALKLPVEGHEHNALFDVRSTAAALDYWIKSGQLNLAQLAK